MKTGLFLLFSICFLQRPSAQQPDSIYFNLYTDSLKPGTYNYINVEGRYRDGRYLPLTEKELKFTSSDGTFSRNSLFIDTSLKKEKVTVRVALLQNPSIWKETTIYIKKIWGNEKLPTVEEVMKRPVRDSSIPPERKKRK